MAAVAIPAPAAAPAPAPKAVASPARLSADSKKKEKVTTEYIDKVLVQKPELDGTEYGLEGVSRYKAGGMLCNNKEDMAAQKGVAKDLLASFGSNLLHGRSLISISLPVRIFEPRSFLQRIPDAWAFAPVFLSRAALAADPVERFKLCITFFVAGLHRATTQRKPFNPILGETFQATFSDGSEIFLEQTSHHPPVSAFQVFGPDGLWNLSGQHEFKASIRPTSITGGQYGPNHIDFPASAAAGASRVTYEMPACELSGVLMGDRVMLWTGSTTFSDKTHGLECKIVFNPDKLGTLSSFFATAKTLADTIRGDVVQTKTVNNVETKSVVSKMDGAWMENVNFDGKTYWVKNSIRAFTPIPVDRKVALPSDCLFREDLQALMRRDMEVAQQLKGLMEDKQRADKELRKAHAKAAAKASKKAGKEAAAAAAAATAAAKQK